MLLARRRYGEALALTEPIVSELKKSVFSKPGLVIPHSGVTMATVGHMLIAHALAIVGVERAPRRRAAHVLDLYSRLKWYGVCVADRNPELWLQPKAQKLLELDAERGGYLMFSLSRRRPPDRLRELVTRALELLLG